MFRANTQLTGECLENCSIGTAKQKYVTIVIPLCNVSLENGTLSNGSLSQVLLRVVEIYYSA